MFRARLSLQWLESRENPSGPTPLDPYGGTSEPPPPEPEPEPTSPAQTQEDTTTSPSEPPPPPPPTNPL